MNQEHAKVSLAVILNLFASGVGTSLGRAQDFMSVLVPIGQFAVSVVTVIYIVAKIRSSNKKDKQ